MIFEIKEPGYYLIYCDKTIGPIAPDNPAWAFIDERIKYKCNTWIAIMKEDYEIDYTVELIND